jgi:2-keto-4-pentenoate hydratase
MSASEQHAAAIADRLFAEHKGRQQFRPISGPERPETLEGGYEVQRLLNDRFRAAGRGAAVGYKVGLTSEAIQKLCNCDQPISGVIFESVVHHSPARIKLSDYVHLGVEFELAVKIGTDFRPDDAPFSREDAAERVAACMPAFELIDDRHADYGELDALSILADNSWCDGIVLGSPVTEWRGLDLATNPVSLRINDAPPEAAVTGAAMGHPLQSLVWLANQLAGRGETLASGMVAMTGSTLVTQFPNVGDRFAYEVAGLGTVEAEIV